MKKMKKGKASEICTFLFLMYMAVQLVAALQRAMNIPLPIPVATSTVQKIVALKIEHQLYF